MSDFDHSRPRYNAQAEYTGPQRREYEGPERRHDPVTPWQRVERFTMLAGFILAFGGVLGIFVVNPFMMAAEAQQVHERNDKRITALEDKFDSINRTGLLNLQNTLEVAIANTKRDMRDSGLSASVLRTLKEACREKSQQLQQVEQQLNYLVTAIDCDS